MLLTKTIAKAEKLSGEKIQRSGLFIFVNYKGYSIQFHANGREEEGCESSGFYTLKHGEKDDHYSDYFAGTFHDNLTQCFKFIDRRAADNNSKQEYFETYHPDGSCTHEPINH